MTAVRVFFGVAAYAIAVLIALLAWSKTNHDPTTGLIAVVSAITIYAVWSRWDDFLRANQ